MTKMTRRFFIASLPPALLAMKVPALAAPAKDLQLIANQKLEPAIVTLHRRLERLTSTLTFMTTGAHPDDEPSGMLAALRHVYGIRPVLYCITRGEGGQNSIGAERGSVLGVLRTREMEEASRALDASLVFGGRGHNDSVHDFGFSKDPNDTINRWGRDRVIERMTWAFRHYKPDIVMNCFLDVPGQHGQHRAAAVATFITSDLSGKADAFPEHIQAGLDTWNVPKIYSPAYGGAGGVYDDQTPPPPVTLTVKAPARDKISGATYPQLGEWSRSCHLTQAMGKWRPEPQTEWPLHLAKVAHGTPAKSEADIREGLIATVGDIAIVDGMPSSAADALANAQGYISEALSDYSDPALVTKNLIEIGKAVKEARKQLPEELRANIAHRLERKSREIDLALSAASGVHIRAFTVGGDVKPGDDITVSTIIDAPEEFRIETVEVVAREGLNAENDKISVAKNAALTNPLTEQFDPLGGNGDAYVKVTANVGDYQSVLNIDLEDALRVIPAASLELKPDAIVINTAREIKPIEISATVTNAETNDLEIDMPEGWELNKVKSSSKQSANYRLQAPGNLGQVRFDIEPKLLNDEAYAINVFSYPHIGRSVVPTKVSVPVQTVEAKLPPEHKVGYVSGGNDNVGLWMSRLGVDVVELSPSDIERGNYEDLKTIVVGIFAFGRRPELVTAAPALHEWVNNGGHLVTLYHRPSDGWDPEKIPPAFLKIGSPSIRFRVTNAKSEVDILEPDHPLFNYPNIIGAEDWANWDKERGLYFASEWDEAYKPLIALSDEGEDKLKGALLSAQIGEGRHTHTSLVLHHQLDKLVPGSFRLLSNLLQPAKIATH